MRRGGQPQVLLTLLAERGAAYTVDPAGCSVSTHDFLTLKNSVVYVHFLSVNQYFSLVEQDRIILFKKNFLSVLCPCLRRGTH